MGINTGTPSGAQSLRSHHWIAFYPADWKSGTAHLPRSHRSIYFDICCRIWETAKPVPPLEVRFIISDLPNGVEVLDELVESGKLVRLDGGYIFNERAMDEAEKAVGKVKQWRSAGKASGRARAERKRNERSTDVEQTSQRLSNESESDKKEGSVPDGTGAVAPDLGLDDGSFVLPDPTGFGNKADWFFHPAVVGFVRSGGASERATRSFIGRLRSLVGDPTAAKRILEAVEAKPSDPVAWLRSRLPKGTANTGVNRRTFDDVDYGESGPL